MAAKRDLFIETGVTFTKTFLWKNADGSRKSLAGLAGKLQIRKKVGSPVLAEISTEDGNIQLEAVEVDGDATGTFTITLPGPLTLPIRELTATYDARFWTDAAEDGEPSYRPIDGDIEFDLAVTK
jgi:hypothetical protein